jgi:hypothetical protein
LLEYLRWQEWPTHEEAQLLKQEIEHCARCIERAYASPQMPSISIRYTDDLFRRGGYVPQRDADEKGEPSPCHIEMSVEGRSPRLTFAHEWGHYVDNWLADFVGYASVETDDLADILAQAEASNTITQLRQFVKRSHSTFDERIEALRLLVPQEIWARAYAQYIALQSDDAVMGHELTLRRTDARGLLSHLEYWEQEDFQPIAQAINTFLRGRGWQQ